MRRMNGGAREYLLPAVPNPLNNNVSTRPTYLYEYNAQVQMTKLADAPVMSPHRTCCYTALLGASSWVRSDRSVDEFEPMIIG